MGAKSTAGVHARGEGSAGTGAVEKYCERRWSGQEGLRGWWAGHRLPKVRSGCHLTAVGRPGSGVI